MFLRIFQREGEALPTKANVQRTQEYFEDVDGNPVYGCRLKTIPTERAPHTSPGDDIRLMHRGTMSFRELKGTAA